ncbi:efflux RND transporter periplasmic adaptor subunit [Aquisphaera insulae]|uniref:efflux RND transporter periplasmic adaptor subunit n=1 Tax=Aquisphaera insulae TaxID=2712864 RepID=UPI0013EA08DB|nr:efflux RND transporter periplasmic adaptor subunit [Aquisphaera insulae]
MSTKILWPVVGLALTFLAIWQAVHAGWLPATFPPAEPKDRQVAAAGPDPERLRPEAVLAEGRLVTYPDAEVVVATELPGMIIGLPVREKSIVRKGDLIAELSSTELAAACAEAAARIDEAEAEIRFYRREVRRTLGLVTRHAASELELETNQRGLDTAYARRRAAMASRSRHEALLAKTHITSPIDGTVIARSAHPGEAVGASARIAVIADLGRVRVEAEVDEVDIGGIALGSEARVTAEGFPGCEWCGRVEEIPDAVVGRQLRPEDPSRPVDTRVLLVKIALLEATPLKLGQRLEIEIFRSRSPSPR